MTHPEPTLLLTRPEPQSRDFLEMCQMRAGRALPAVISPILRIEPTGAVPELDRFDTIILTSANAVTCLADRADLTGRTVVTVGARTAEAARDAGAVATMLGQDASELIAAAYRIEGRAVFCRGAHSRGEIARHLRDRGVTVEEVVIYDQVEQPLSSAAKALFKGKRPIIVPLFSPRSASILANQAEIDAPLTLVAMSNNVAAAWSGPGRILVAASPTADGMCDVVIAEF